MRRTVCTLGLSVLLLVTSSCGQSANSVEFRLVAEVDELMLGMVDPLADIVFESVGIIMTLDGIEEIVPQNDEEWDQVLASALALGEVANLLTLDARAAAYEADWIELSRAMTDRSLEAADAARAQDKDELLLAGGNLYQSCLACHEKYLVEEEIF